MKYNTWAMRSAVDRIALLQPALSCVSQYTASTSRPRETRAGYVVEHVVCQHSTVNCLLLVAIVLSLMIRLN